MLGLASEEELKRIRQVIQHHAPYLGDDIESLIYLGQMEMQGAPDDERNENFS